MDKTKELKRLVEEIERFKNKNINFKVYINENGEIDIDITYTDRCTSIEEAILTLNIIINRLKE